MELSAEDKLKRFRDIAKIAKKLSKQRRIKNHKRALDHDDESMVNGNVREVWDE